MLICKMFGSISTVKEKSWLGFDLNVCVIVWPWQVQKKELREFVYSLAPRAELESVLETLWGGLQFSSWVWQPERSLTVLFTLLFTLLSHLLYLSLVPNGLSQTSRAVNQVKSDKDKLRNKSKSFDVFAIVHYNLLLHDKRFGRWEAR